MPMAHEPYPDFGIRNAAFEFVREISARSEDGAVAWSDLVRGFPYEGRRITLAGQRGIWRPAACELPLSIRTTPPDEYGRRLGAGLAGQDDTIPNPHAARRMV